MADKMIHCREHGGTFTIEARRGRPPVKCSESNPCSRTEVGRKRVATSIAKTTAERHGLTGKSKRPTRDEVRQEVVSTMAAAPDEKAAKPRSTRQPVKSLGQAKAAKAQLEGQGWTVAGRGGTDGVTVTASRGEELITMHWSPEGKVTQSYVLWDMEKPSANGKPYSKLGFDADEMSDRELVQKLSGMRVTWWNRLASGEETAIIGNTMTIEHCYSGTGNETPADRIIKFVDVNGGGYRAFRIGALIEIGG